MSKIVAFQTQRSKPKECRKSEFNDWDQIKRCSVDSIYKKVLHFRSAIYPVVLTRSRTNTPATVHRRRKRTESMMAADAMDGRSSALSSNNETPDNDNYFKEDFDFDGEEPEEPPLYPHLVHKPGTHCQEVYMKACNHLEISPSSAVYRSLTGERVSAQRQCLGPTGVKAVAISLAETLTVQALDLTENDIGVEGARYVGELIIENNFLRYLNLSNNNLGQEGIEVLADAIKTVDSIETLILAGNCIRGQRALCLKRIIEDTQHLKKLDLSSNDLGDMGGAIVGEALAGNDTLEELDLGWNQLRDISKIAESLAKNASLRLLILSGNGVHQTGSAAIARALERNGTLESLDVSQNRLDRGCLETLFAGLKKNTSLRKLSIGHNPIKQNEAKLVLDFLVENTASGLNAVDLEGVSVDNGFLVLLGRLHEDRKLEIVHGHLRGAEIGVPDVNEGMLLQATDFFVWKELENIIGIDLEAFINGVSSDIGRALDSHQVALCLQLLNNPLSERCTAIFVSRLKHGHTIDIRTLGKKREERIRLYERERQAREESKDTDVPTEAEVRDTREQQAIMNAIQRVYMRKLSGSSLYKQRIQAMRRTLSIAAGRGEQRLRKHVTNVLKSEFEIKETEEA
ncbi:PH domain leucine-rich repeat protein phosphatase 1-like isoform X1 [Mya arenaria]|uniref:PH domain leucine-rich repeat protein phosphatase 1-like isoform X1 n=1 Tax=Mya arenaria TaxID=6604 RepID=UPI0022E60D7E|nr:PH domain leucine-rich repeat protein phosphatase 1-like isoform X1 [Mya arenaria]